MGMLLHPPLVALYYLRRGQPSEAEVRRRGRRLLVPAFAAYIAMSVWVAIEVSSPLGVVLAGIAVVFGLFAWLAPKLPGERSDPPPVRRVRPE